VRFVLPSQARNSRPSSDYRECSPPPALAADVLCFWSKTITSAAESQQHVLPDGCVDLLIINGNPVIVGPWNKPFRSGLAAGTNIVAARFHPGSASHFLGLPASELLNHSLPLCDIWNHAASEPFQRIALESVPSLRMSALVAAMLQRATNLKPVDRTTTAAIQWIAAHPSGRVDDLSQWLGMSHRQIQRRFTAAVGYGPKLFQSVLRFQRLLHLASRPNTLPGLAQCAAHLNYADQAHMAREVHRFSGTTPTRLLDSPLCALRLSRLLHPPLDTRS
jgi:AraC-like DNA-binding protein